MVVGVDFGKLADRAFEVGYGMCLLHPAADLHVVSVVKESDDAYPVPEAPAAVPRLNLEAAARQLAAHVVLLMCKLSQGTSRNVRVTSHVLFDVPVIGITNLARELDAQMIVVGTHGRRGLARWLLGSVAEGILRHASCPVFVIPPPTDPGPLQVVDAVCEHCVRARHESEGGELWCAEHRARLDRRHTHHQAMLAGGDGAA
jgi:nucleotide-binding universal stress UspA family protein